MDPQLLHDLVRATITVAGADMGNIQLMSDGVLQIAASHGFERDFLEFFDTVDDTNCACGVALRSGTAIIVEDVRTSPIFADTPARDVVLRAGVLSVVSMPIVTHTGAVRGVLSAHRRTVGRPAPDELGRLEWLARQAADVMEGTASQLAVRAVEVLGRNSSGGASAK